MIHREFREKIFDYRMGQKYGSNEVFDDEVILASRAIDDFYKTIGKEYDSLKIVETSLTRQLNTLDTIIANTKNVKKKQEFILTRAKLQKR